MKALQAFAAFALLGCTPAAGADQQALMDRIEAHVVMPRGADPLAAYDRAYAWDPRAPARSKVVAVYLHLGAARPGRRWVTADALPIVMDGGCGVVTLTYDVASNRVERIGCNGYA